MSGGRFGDVMIRSALTLVAALALTAHAAGAQQRDRDRDRDGIPPGQRPPAGMCRIWLNNVPAGQQPAPTDCATAVRNRPEGARIIFSDERPNAKLPVKTLTQPTQLERLPAATRVEKRDDKKKKKDP